MFKKGCKVKTTCTLLRNKEVKKIQSLVKELYPSCSDEDYSKIFPTGKTPLMKWKFAQSRIVVYQIPPSESDHMCVNEPILFDPDGKLQVLVPTVYLLWKVPRFAPQCVIQNPASTFILRGADVMYPGVILNSSNAPASSFVPNEIRSVVTKGNSSAPFAIGKVANAVSGDNTGKAIEVYHIYGDNLWELGSNSRPNEGFSTSEILPVETSPASVSSEDSSSVPEETMTTQEESVDQMDELIFQTFLKAIKSKIRKQDCPILTSAFYAQMMLPSRPVNTSLSLKKSSYKKLSVFLKEMQERQYIELSYPSPGVEVISWFDKRGISRDMTDHSQTTEEYNDEKAAAELEEKASMSGNVFCNTGLYPPVVSVWYKIEKKKVQNMLRISDTGIMYSSSQLKQLILDYATEDDFDYKNVLVTGEMIDALSVKKNSDSGTYPTSIPKADLVLLFEKACQGYYTIQLSPLQSVKKKAKRGAVPVILVAAEKRMGNKTVTTVGFLKAWGIDEEEFSNVAQKAFASSTAIQESVHGHKTREVVIQGMVVDEVCDYLKSSYNIPKEYLKTTMGKGIKKKKKKN